MTRFWQGLGVFGVALALSVALPAGATDPTPIATASRNAGPAGDALAFWTAVQTAIEVPGAQRSRIREVVTTWQSAHPDWQRPAVDELQQALRRRGHGAADLAETLGDAARTAEIARRAALAAQTLDDLERLARAGDRGFWARAEEAHAQIGELTFTDEEAAAFEAAWQQRCVEAVDATLAGGVPADLDALTGDLRRVQPSGYKAQIARIAGTRQEALRAVAIEQERAAVAELPGQIPGWAAEGRWLDVVLGLVDLEANGQPLPWSLPDAREHCAAPHEALARQESATPAARWMHEAIAARCRGTFRPVRDDAHVRPHFRAEVEPARGCDFLTHALALPHGDPDGNVLSVRVEGQCLAHERHWTTTGYTTVVTWLPMRGVRMQSFVQNVAYPIENRKLSLSIDGRLAIRFGRDEIGEVPLSYGRTVEEEQHPAIGEVPEKRFGPDTLAGFEAEAVRQPSAALTTTVGEWLEATAADMRGKAIAAARARHDDAGREEEWVIEAWATGRPPAELVDWLERRYHVKWWQI
jgi:hypothetical protein